MKTYFTRIVFLSSLLFTAFSSFSQTTENFNARGSYTPEQVKGALQSSCWQLSGFVTAGAPAAIEGDGSLLLDPALTTSAAGLYTPVLDLKGTADISFTYRYPVQAAYTRWIRICLADVNNQLVKVLDSVEISNTPANKILTYRNTVNSGTGVYRLLLQYTDSVRTSPVSIDQLQISARLHYASGCNQAPIALSDAFSASASTGFASGNVLLNDRDPDGDALSAYLISGSSDGTVNLLSNGAFSFTPRSGFTGSSTHFTYKVCDNGYGQLCSATAIATILFSPGTILPVRYVDINGGYNNGQVLINWTTAYENSTENFDLERGTDSVVFKKITSVKGYGTLGSINFYKYSDDQSPEVNQLKELYYRVKSSDVNGKIVYSPVVKVKIEGITGLRDIKVTPNPVTSNIAVNIQLNRNCGYTVNVLSVTGGLVYQQVMQGEAGTNRITLAGTAQLQKGLYFVQVVIDKKEKLITRIIKQ